MEEIGGYFELELQKTSNQLFDTNAVFVNSGRNALEYILKSLPTIGVLWVPYYTCSSLLEPLSRLHVEVKYYHITAELEIRNLDSITLEPNDYLLYTNYFGVKNKYTDFLQSKYPINLIVDNSQALFYPPSRLCFYSPRKYVGIPDGGVAFSPYQFNVVEQDKLSYLRCSHLLKRYDYLASDGYADFKNNGLLIANQSLKRMSNLTRSLMESINYEEIRKKRNDNFEYLHAHLKEFNQLTIDLNLISGPLVYPFLFKNKLLRKKLIDNKVYIPTYWPNIMKSVDKESVESYLSQNILPLPIDQRYSEINLNRILSFIE